MRATIENVRFYLDLYNGSRRHDMPAYTIQRTNGYVNIVELDTREGSKGCPRSYAEQGLTTREAYYVARALANSVIEVR